jgi:hypothetical protein
LVLALNFVIAVSPLRRKRLSIDDTDYRNRPFPLLGCLLVQLPQISGVEQMADVVEAEKALR